MKKRIICFVLAILAMVFAAASCKTAEETGKIGDGEGNAEDQAKKPDEISTEASRLYPDVPDNKFGGYSFRVMTCYLDNVDWVDWVPRDITAESENGDLINDAVYKRNITIEERYEIKVEEISTEYSIFSTRLRTSAAAGDHDFDIALPLLNDVIPTYAQDGLLADLKTMAFLDFSKPWWNQACVRQLSIGNRLYFAQGDLTILDNDSMGAMVFNKKLLQDHDIENPYELVKSGRWTLDKLAELSKGVAVDLNGDGAMELADDKFGLVVQRNTVFSLYAASGGTIVGKDKDDLPYIDFASDKSYTLLAKITELMRDSQNTVDLHRYEGKLAVYDEQTKLFSENRALFMWIRMRVVETLRNMEADFGIVPLPKHDEKQEHYISKIDHGTSSAIVMLKTNPDFDRSCMILEALACESKYTLQPAYYDLNLKVKQVRDDESESMLDIIYDNGLTFYDIAEMYNFGNFTGTVRRIPTHGGDTNYASLFEKVESAMQKDIDKVIANYQKAAE